MDLHRQLREETRPLHDKMEQSYLFKKILTKEITFAEYSFLITKFHNFIAPCENLINQHLYKSLINNREKTALLEEDLRALKVNNNLYDEQAYNNDLPPLERREHVLGYLYVIEGSTLGGQIITRLLAKQLGISANNGAKFFYAYGDKTKFMWNHFCEQLKLIEDILQQNSIIEAAISTYSALHQWMDVKDSFKGVKHG